MGLRIMNLDGLLVFETTTDLVLILAIVDEYRKNYAFLAPFPKLLLLLYCVYDLILCFLTT